MKNISQLDEAQLRHEFRQMYKEIGYKACLQVMYELIVSFNILTEVVSEEVLNEKA